MESILGMKVWEWMVRGVLFEVAGIECGLKDTEKNQADKIV